MIDRNMCEFAVSKAECRLALSEGGRIVFSQTAIVGKFLLAHRQIVG